MISISKIFFNTIDKFSTRDINLGNVSPKILNELIQNGSKIYMKAKFDSDENELFEEFNILSDGFVYFQTDKSIYRITETVKFRILRTDKELKPIPDQCNLTIKVIISIW